MSNFFIGMNLDPDFVSQLNMLKDKYGEKFDRLNGLHNDNLNFTGFIDNFIDSNTVADATIDGNANASTKDICSMEAEMSKPHKKLLCFNKIYYELKKRYGRKQANKWLELEWNGAFYLHDAYSATLKPYCYAYDLEDLVNNGLHFVSGFGGGAPKHLTTFTAQTKEFVSWTSNRTSGACGLPSFLIYSFYFWKKDVEDGFYLKSPEYYRDQSFQEIIFGLNQPYLRVNQSAFTNFTIMDRYYLEEMFGEREYPDGTYVIDYIDDIIEYQKSFMRVVSKVRKESMFTFPVLTFSLLKKKNIDMNRVGDWDYSVFVDEDFARWCCRHNMEWGDSNFFSSEDITSLSSCCRLINDFSKLDGFINSIGGTQLSIGSIKVNTINLARIAYESKGDRDKYFEILRDRVDTCVKTLDVIRSIITRNIEKGLLPNYTSGLIDIEHQYNTIGINGMFEAVRFMGGTDKDEFLGETTYNDFGVEFASEILDSIGKWKEEYKFKYSINIEAVPAERCAVILKKKDEELFDGKVDIDKTKSLYGNQWIPLDEKTTLAEKIRLGSILDAKCGGGQIMHANVNGKFTSERQAWATLNTIVAQGVIYFAYNMRISTCKHRHGFVGLSKCPVCGEPVADTFTRVVGFYTPVSAYSTERSEEYAHRFWYDLND